jgi:hypothetical protein
MNMLAICLGASLAAGPGHRLFGRAHHLQRVFSGIRDADAAIALGRHPRPQRLASAGLAGGDIRRLEAGSSCVALTQ